MRNLGIFAIGYLVIGYLSLAAAGTDTEPNSALLAKDISELKLANRELKRLASELKRRLARLEALQETAKDIPLGLDSNSIPQGWQRREFNGLPYYVVPLLDGLNTEFSATSPSAEGAKHATQSR